MKKTGLICTAALALLSAPLPAQEPPRIDMQGISIIGDQELPKVLYIVPWKNAAAGASIPPPEARLDESLLVPLDRDVVRRQLRYQAAGAQPVTSSERLIPDLR